MKTKNIFHTLFFTFILSFCGNHLSAQQQNIEVKLIQVKGGWGYDIFVDGKQYIHQETIPSIQGNYAFKTETDARKTAGLVIAKLRKNIMPPSVTPEELDSIKVLSAEIKAVQPVRVKTVKPAPKPEKEKELKLTPHNPNK